MLIALNGQKNSGKDTFASFLVNNYGFYRVAFADKLKESAAALFDIEPHLWDVLKNDSTADITLRWGREGLVKDVSARQFLQLYGTESHRSVFYDDFWIDATIPDNIEEYEEWANGRDVVITDARFSNELKRVRDLEGKVVRIERPELETNDSHVSESMPPSELIDEIISNHGDLSDLEIMADLLVARLLNQEASGIQLSLHP